MQIKLKWLLSRWKVHPVLGERLNGEEGERVPEQELLQHPCSVSWLDLGHSSLCAELFAEYHTLLRRVCGQALWQHFHFPTGHRGSLNLCSEHQKFLLLHTWRQAATTGIQYKRWAFINIVIDRYRDIDRQRNFGGLWVLWKDASYIFEWTKPSFWSLPSGFQFGEEIYQQKGLLIKCQDRIVIMLLTY